MIGTVTRFNPTQIHLLRMFELTKTKNELDEMKDVLYQHYSKKLHNTLDDMWDEGSLSQERLDEIAQLDLHKL